jgi:hypothetical protein
MIMNPTYSGASGGLTMEIPPNLLRPFQQTEMNLREVYQTSPDIPTLIRMWLACATPGQLQEEFEEAVRDLPGADQATGEGGIVP